MPHTMEKLLALLQGKADGIENLEWRINMAARALLTKITANLQPASPESLAVNKLKEEIPTVI